MAGAMAGAMVAWAGAAPFLVAGRAWPRGGVVASRSLSGPRTCGGLPGAGCPPYLAIPAPADLLSEVMPATEDRPRPAHQRRSEGPPPPLRPHLSRSRGARA